MHTCIHTCADRSAPEIEANPSVCADAGTPTNNCSICLLATYRCGRTFRWIRLLFVICVFRVYHISAFRSTKETVCKFVFYISINLLGRPSRLSVRKQIIIIKLFWVTGFVAQDLCIINHKTFSTDEFLLMIYLYSKWSLSPIPSFVIIIRMGRNSNVKSAGDQKLVFRNLPKKCGRIVLTWWMFGVVQLIMDSELIRMEPSNRMGGRIEAWISVFGIENWISDSSEVK